MTPVQQRVNALASISLEKGKYYRFNPPAKTTAIPTGGPDVCALVECTFDRGWYIGCLDDKHMFQGKPINDTRKIRVPKGYSSQIAEKLRESYFAVLFIGGVSVSLDSNQNK